MTRERYPVRERYPWETPEYLYLKRYKPKTALLEYMLFSGDTPRRFREACETMLLVRGWMPDGELIILIDPPPGDLGIRYKGIPRRQCSS